MTTSSQTVELIFQGIDKTSEATRSALSNVQSFTGSVKDITQPIADFTAGTVKLEAGLLTAGAAMLAFSVKSASDFDSAFRQISTIIDASAGDLDKFKQAILSYATTSTQPLEQITNALGAAIGSGVKYTDSLALLSVAEKLAVATRSDLDGTTKVLVSTLNSYGLSMDQAGKISDLFFKIIDDGDIGMADLANSFAKVAPVAKISGVALEEVGAAIATLTASGIKPAESIEYLRGAINNIINPTKQGAELAEELGIQFNAAGLKANGLSGLLQQVAAKTGGSAEQMKILFGDIGGFTAAATLAGPQAEKFAEVLKGMGNVAGATDAAFAKVTGSLDVAGAKIASAFKTLTVAIGQPLLDEFGGVANAIASIFQALGDSAKNGALGELVKYIEENLQALQKTVETVAKNLPAALKTADFSGFKDGIDAVLNSLKLLFSSIDLTTVDGLAKAIETVGAAFLGLSKFTAGVIDSFKPLFDYIVDIGSGVTDLNPEIFELAGNFAGFATQINILASGLASIMPMFEGLVALLVANQGLSLLAGLRALITTAPILGTALSTALLPLVAAGTAALAVKNVVDLGHALEDLSNAHTRLKESEEASGKVSAQVAQHLSDFAQQTGLAVKSLDEAIGLVDDGTVVWDEATKTYTLASGALRETGKAAQEIVNPFEAHNKQLLDALALTKEYAAHTAELKYAQYGLLDSTQMVVPIIDKATGAVTGYERQLTDAARQALGLSANTGKSADALDKVAKKTKEAEESQRKWNEEVLKMQHDEKMKMIEAQTTITTARLEADAKKITAAFESINTTVNSTGDVIASLFNLIRDPDSLSWSALRSVESQIDKENAHRDEALNLQTRLTQAQIKEIEARTKQLEAGDALIKIDGSGLKPHLEAFMWEILRAIQTRVNRDGLELLVGV